MATSAPIIRSIVGCARCHGEGHEDLNFEPLSYPIEVYVGISDGTIEATHWAPCPTNGQPILMAIIETS